MKGRTILIRALAVLVLAVTAGICMIVGRGHTVYLDNKTVELEGESVPAFYKVVVYVGGERAASLNARERGQTICIGQSLRMTLEITPEKGGETETREVALGLPYDLDGVIVSLPAYLAGLPEEAWLTEFVPAPVQEDEEVPEDEGIPGGEEDLGLSDI